MADAAHRPAEAPVGRAEAQAVEERDRPRPHRDDVAEDSPDPGGRALEGLDGRGVVVALDLERDGLVAAHVDHAGVLTRALEHHLALGREAAQQECRVLVSAVLRPEEREDRELEVVRLPLQEHADAVELDVGEAEDAVEPPVCDRAQGPETLEARSDAGRDPIGLR